MPKGIRIVRKPGEGPADRKVKEVAKRKARALRVKKYWTERVEVNPGAPWKPAPKQISDRGTVRLQTEEEAWDDARVMVRHMVAMGMTKEQIGRCMKPMIGLHTLNRYFWHELENGLLIQNLRVGGTAFAMATSGQDGAMTRYWLDRRAGWSQETGTREPIQIMSMPGDDDL